MCLNLRLFALIRFGLKCHSHWLLCWSKGKRRSAHVICEDEIEIRCFYFMEGGPWYPQNNNWCSSCIYFMHICPISLNILCSNPWFYNDPTKLSTRILIVGIMPWTNLHRKEFGSISNQVSLEGCLRRKIWRNFYMLNVAFEILY